MEWKLVFFLAVFLASSAYAFKGDFNLLDSTPGQQSIFNTSIDCNPDANNFVAGDFIDYKVFYCADFNCSLVWHGNIVIDGNCYYNYQNVVQIPPEYFRLSFDIEAKKYSDNNYSSFGFALYERHYVQPANPGPPTEPNSFLFQFPSLSWVVFAGILLVFLGLLFLWLRKWWGIFLFFAGILAIVAGLLYKL